MDAVDLALLDQLQKDASLSNQDLAARVHVSPPTCLRRVKRLREAGLELPAAAGPRQIATAVTARFGSHGRGLADWLLRLEAQRYARAPSASLTTLQREFNQLAWPS